MNSFSYLVPTKVIFGKDALESLGGELSACQSKKVLVLYGGGSVVKSGVLGKVTDILDQLKVSYVTLGGVQPNPILSKVYEAKELCLKEGVDFILAVGGGSTLDTAKALSLAVAEPDMDIWDFFMKKVSVTKRVPFGSVLTIAAAGSETSNSAVITNVETKEKRGSNTELYRPVFAILNPEFTYTLPKFQITCGVVDILMHTFDRYFSSQMDNEITDQIAEGLIRTVMMHGITAMNNPTDYKAMSEIMWCGSISHNGITGLGNVQDFSPHRIGRDISGIYDSAHGATLSVAWVGFANFVVKDNIQRFARYGRNVFGLQGTDEAVAKESIAKTTQFFVDLDMPITLTQLLGKEPTDKELEDLTLACMEGDKNAVYGTMHSFTYEDTLALYKSVR